LSGEEFPLSKIASVDKWQAKSKPSFIDSLVILATNISIHLTPH
jgi:hypothetical protein